MRTPNNWSKWLKVCFFWTLLTSVGWTIGMFIMQDTNLLIGIPAFGLALGFSQSLVLYSKSFGVGWEKGFGLWILATIFGSILGFVTLALLNTIGLNFISLASCGAAFGFSQWLVLRKKIRLSGLWILATAIGWLALNVSKWPFWQGLGFGFVTGVFLVWSLAQTQVASVEKVAP